MQITSFLLVNCANTHHYEHRSSRFFPHPITPDPLPSHVKKNHPDCLHTDHPRWAENGKRSTFLYISDCFLAGDTLKHARVNEARFSKRCDSFSSEAALYLGQAEGTGTSGVPVANRRALEENSRINALIRST